MRKRRAIRSNLFISCLIKRISTAIANAGIRQTFRHGICCAVFKTIAMKNRFVSVCLIALILASCKETKTEPAEAFRFVFDHPQPIGGFELDHFPARFTGVYQIDESSSLTIESDRISEESNFEFSVAKKDLDSLKDIGTFRNDEFIVADKAYKMTDKGDSISITDHSVKTLFRLSANQKLKRIGRHLVVSEKDSVFWRSSVLYFDKDSLQWQRLFKVEDIPQLQRTVKDVSVGDTTIVCIKPTRKEFKKILEQKQLGWKTGYKKIK